MSNSKAGDMKRGVIVFLIILMIPGIRLAGQTTNLEKLNSYKIAFFTRRLNLTSQEAEKFWPIFNEYQKQKSQIQIDKMLIINNFNQNESTLNDKQLIELGEKLVSTSVQESSLAVTFHAKLKEVLSPAKVIRFYQSENQYKIQLLNELQSRQKERPIPRRNLP